MQTATQKISKYNLKAISVVWEMLILSGFHLNDLNTAKDTTKAKFIKYFNDKRVVFNNQIIIELLLLGTHGCKHCQTRGFTVQQSRQANLFLIQTACSCKTQVTVEKNLSPSLRYDLEQLEGNICSSTSLKIK